MIKTFLQTIMEDRIPSISLKFEPQFKKLWLNTDMQKEEFELKTKQWDSLYKAMVRAFTAIDPSPNNIYTQYIFQAMLSIVVDKPANFNIRGWTYMFAVVEEDAHMIHSDLVIFDRVKARMPIDLRDINKFKTIADLSRAIRPYEQTISKTQEDVNRIKELYTLKQITLLHKDSNGKIEIPHTKEASIFLGRGTRWCTAATNNNFFDSYNKRGNLYIITDSSGVKYQIHLESKSFMDARDLPIDQNVLQKLGWVFQHIKVTIEDIARNPKIIPYIKNLPEAVLLNVIKQNPYSIKHMLNPTEAMMLKAVKENPYSIREMSNPTEAVMLEAVKISCDAIEFIKNPTEAVQLRSLRRNALMINHIKNPTPLVKLTALKMNPNIKI